MVDKKQAAFVIEIIKENQELLKQIETFKHAKSPEDCPFCSKEKFCVPHERLSQVEARGFVKELENRLADKESLIQFLEKRINDLEAENGKIPMLIASAKETAVPELNELLKQHDQHVEFASRVSRRLGIHPKGTLSQIQNRIEDAIRKL